MGPLRSLSMPSLSYVAGELLCSYRVPLKIPYCVTCTSLAQVAYFSQFLYAFLHLGFLFRAVYDHRV